MRTVEAHSYNGMHRVTIDSNGGFSIEWIEKLVKSAIERPAELEILARIYIRHPNCVGGDSDRLFMASLTKGEHEIIADVIIPNSPQPKLLARMAILTSPLGNALGRDGWEIDEVWEEEV